MPRNLAYRLRKISSRVVVSGQWLDCGCADGSYTSGLLGAGATSVIGTDVEQDRIAAARRQWSDATGLRFEVAPAEDLPFADASFDGVLMNEVLEHVRDENRSLEEIHRVLRPGGVVVVISPNRYFPFEGHGLQLGSFRVDSPIPFLPWLPGSIGRHLMRARNYWPSELRSLVDANRLDVFAVESVFPVFEIYPWLPGLLQRWYWRNLPRLERLPLLRRFGVSTMVVARKADLASRDERPLSRR
jgi:SAM-dependent methyltransferase